MSTYFRGVNANLITLYDSPAGIPAALTYGLYNPGGAFTSLAAFADGTPIWRTTKDDGIIIYNDAKFNITKEGGTDFVIGSDGGIDLAVATGQVVTTVVNSVDIMAVGASGIDLKTTGANITKSGAAALVVSSASSDVALDAATSSKVDFKINSTSIAQVKETGIQLQDDAGYNLSKAGTTDLKVSSGAGIQLQAAFGGSVIAQVNGTTELKVETGTLTAHAGTVTLDSSGSTTTIQKTAGSVLALQAPLGIQLNTGGGGNVSVNSDIVLSDLGVTLETSGANITKSTGDLKINSFAGNTQIQNASVTKLTVASSTVTLGTGVGTLTSTDDITIKPADNKILYIETSVGGQVIFNTANGYPKLSATFAGTGANDLATKGYVDTIAAGIQPKAACRVATVAQLTATFASSGATGGTITATANGAISVDGVSLSLADRVLVKDGTSAGDTGVHPTSNANGIYTVTTVGDGSNPYVLTRSSDMDGAPTAEVSSGIYTYILEGTANANKAFILTTANPIVLNTTNLTFSLFSSGAAGITGPGSTTHDAIVRWSSTDGKTVANSSVTLTSGDFTFAAATPGAMIVNATTTDAFEIRTGGGTKYLTVNTTSGNVELAQGGLSFGGATGANKLIFPANLAAGLKLTDGTNDYLTAVSTTGSLATVINQDLQLSKGQKVPVSSFTSAGTTTLDETYFLVRVSGNVLVTFNLPSAAATKHVGRIYKFVNGNSSGTAVTIHPSTGESISGDTADVILSSFNAHMQLISDGVGWYTM